MTVQLPLGLALNDSATFANYFPQPNAAAVHALHACAAGAEPAVVYLWGAPDTGRTHLLQAACHAAAAGGRAVAYLPLAGADELQPEMLDGLEAMALVCLDDVERIAGLQPWEMALFSLFNRLRELGGHLAVSARRRPQDLGLRLPDLVSRLGWGAVFRLRPLDDDQKLAALTLRARGRGLELPPEAGRYLMRRCARDMGALYGLLERLDHASLAAQRRLTVPFIKATLGE
ncbi:MAG: DnaA regulatory inactivator Hda [Gammaproteobacteria bacterium]